MKLTKLLRASDLMAKLNLERRFGGHYDLSINGYCVMCMYDYSKFVSKSRPSTYDQVLISEALAVLGNSNLSHLDLPSQKVYDDLKSTFKRSPKAGKAKALALAKQLYLDDFNRAIQASTWVKNSHSSGVLELKLFEQGDFPYWLRFRDGVDSITVKFHIPVFGHYGIFWSFKTRRIKPLISVLLDNPQWVDVASSLHGLKKESLLRALELALHHDTTLGAALFLAARE